MPQGWVWQASLPLPCDATPCPAQTAEVVQPVISQSLLPHRFQHCQKPPPQRQDLLPSIPTTNGQAFEHSWNWAPEKQNIATGPVTPRKEVNTPYDKMCPSARGRHSLVTPHKHRPWHTCEENALQTAESLWKFMISSKCFQLTSKRNKLQADPKVAHFPPLPNPASSLFSSSLYYLFSYFSSPLWKATLRQNFSQRGQEDMSQ